VIFEGVHFNDAEETHVTKYADLVRQVGTDRIVAAVDDLPEQTADAIKNGIRKVYLRAQPYNQTPDVLGERIESLGVLWLRLRKDIAEWKATHGGN
jgi:hypothetical protein